MGRQGYPEYANAFGGQPLARMSDYEFQLQQQIELVRKQMELQNLQNQMMAMRDRSKIGIPFLKDFEEVELFKNDSIPSKRADNVIQQHGDKIQEQAYAQVHAMTNIQAFDDQTDLKVSEYISTACGNDVANMQKQTNIGSALIEEEVSAQQL